MARTYNGRFYLPEEPKVNAAWLIVGLALIPSWPSFFTMIASIACFVKYGKQAGERKLYRRFQEYCTVIGMRGRVPVKELRNASPAGTGVKEVRESLQKMIARGYFGEGAYIDLSRNELVLPDAAGAARGAQRETAWERAEREGGRSWYDALTDMLSALQRDNVFQGEVREDDYTYRARPGDYDYREVAYESSAPRRRRRRPGPSRSRSPRSVR